MQAILAHIREIRVEKEATCSKEEVRMVVKKKSSERSQQGLL